jgi:pSer/pThr/pTyr-binding forkhead associated (FHA) protein
MPQLQIFLSEDNQVTHDLTDDKVTVGRLADNTLQIEDASVSSHHAELVLEGDTYHLLDLGSTNGTFVNGEATTDAVLKHGDEVRFGRIETIFSSKEAGTESQPLPESSTTTAEVGLRSARPSAFVSTSPVPRTGKEKDPIGAALYAFAGLAIIAAAAAGYFVFSMQGTPV